MFNFVKIYRFFTFISFKSVGFLYNKLIFRSFQILIFFSNLQNFIKFHSNLNIISNMQIFFMTKIQNETGKSSKSQMLILRDFPLITTDAAPSGKFYKTFFHPSLMFLIYGMIHSGGLPASPTNTKLGLQLNCDS